MMFIQKNRTHRDSIFPTSLSRQFFSYAFFFELFLAALAVRFAGPVDAFLGAFFFFSTAAAAAGADEPNFVFLLEDKNCSSVGTGDLLFDARLSDVTGVSGGDAPDTHM